MEDSTPCGAPSPFESPSPSESPSPFEIDVERARRGDAKAFDRIAAAFAPSLVRFVSVVLSGDRDAAHDVVQESLVAAWQSLPDLQRPDLLRGWLFAVAHRRAVSWLRRRGPRGMRFVGIEAGEVDAAAAGPAAGSESARCAQDEAAGQLRYALGRMPQRYSSALTLCYLEGLGLRETARVLAVSVPTLKMVLYRARGLLRRRLVGKDGWTLRRTPRGEPTRTSARVRRDARGGDAREGSGR